MLDIAILCGGYGQRVWPASRRFFPKQFVNLVDKHHSLLQITALRATKLCPRSLTFIVNSKYDFLVKKQLDDISITNYHIISEPIAKNTAPAIATVCNLLPDDSNILVLASDHIWDDDKFVDAVNDGLNYVNDGIVFFAIKPTEPNTGYGYIKSDSNRLVNFVEKPTYDKAVQLLEDGHYSWNSGVFLFNNTIMKNEFIKKQPKMLEYTREAIDKSKQTVISVQLDPDEFSKVDNISIDYAIMELYDNGYVITYDGLWSDVGSYDSIHNCLPKDLNNNVVDARAEMIDTKNCYISSDGRLIATIGIKDTVIVDTKDALLVASIDRCQDVKTIVSRLGDINETRGHLKEFRPWGWYETINGDDHSGHKVKRIHVYPNMKLSLQTHNHRAEHWVIIQGTGKVTIDDTQKIVTKNDYVFIPINAKHRVENIGTVPLEFIETQIGDYLGEDDIKRYDDDWGRH